MPHAVVCPGCQRALVAPGTRCPKCAAAYKAREEKRRRAHPRRIVYADGRWQGIRLRVLRRDGFRCVRCGRHRDELRPPREFLVADHIRGVMNCADPFDVDELQTLCSVCSGRKDGGRAKR